MLILCDFDRLSETFQRHPGAAFSNAWQGSSCFLQSREPPPNIVKSNTLSLGPSTFFKLLENSLYYAPGVSTFQCSMYYTVIPLLCGRSSRGVHLGKHSGKMENNATGRKILSSQKSSTNYFFIIIFRLFICWVGLTGLSGVASA